MAEPEAEGPALAVQGEPVAATDDADATPPPAADPEASPPAASGAEAESAAAASTEEADAEVEEIITPDPAGPDAEPTVPEPPTDVRAWMIGNVAKRVGVPGFDGASLDPEHTLAISRFHSDPATTVLAVFSAPSTDADGRGGVTQGKATVHVRNELPASTEGVAVLSYFLREADTILDLGDSFDEMVCYGTLKGDVLACFADTMAGVFVPMLTRNSDWPQSVQDDFTGGLNRFMSVLVDASSQAKGQTLFYVPVERLDGDPNLIIQDKALVQRLEMAVIHWTRQLKQVLGGVAQDDGSATAELPLDELAYWSRRCDNLSQINSQLEQPNVMRIRDLLACCSSPYLQQFENTATRIKDGTAEATSNTKFLSVLKDPFTKLGAASLTEMPGQLPAVVDLMRVVWANSDCYNTVPRMTALFQKVSTAIMTRCCDEISLDSLFEGDIDACARVLKEAIACCQAWKTTYNAKRTLHRDFSDKPWNLVDASIFAQIDAFIQRCHDLLAVCAGQSHFARKTGSETRPLPVFRGALATQLAAGLDAINEAFQKALEVLKADLGMILDVKSQHWHGVYSDFQAAVADLEVKVQNIIASCFDTTNTVAAGVEVIKAFELLSSRNVIRRVLDKCTAQLYERFGTQIETVKVTFNSQRTQPPLGPSWPRHAGSAMWAAGLQSQLQQTQAVLAAAHFLRGGPLATEVTESYEVLSLALRDFMRKTHAQWTHSLEADLIKLLNVSLMRRGPGRSLLELNFDHTLLRVFQEVAYWKKMPEFEIPPTATEVFNRRDEMRNLREHVLLVVRDYNQIIQMLSDAERDLFRERIRFLDKKIQPGLTKLTWSSKGIQDYYVADCRSNASKLKEIVDEYMASNHKIGRLCTAVEETPLIRINAQRTYSLHEFQEEQARHHDKAFAFVARCHRQVVYVMKQTYQTFKSDGLEVQQHWRRYTVGVDAKFEAALLVCIKRSLQDLSRAINGDGKTVPKPLLRLDVKLAGSAVVLDPAFVAVTNYLFGLAEDLPSSLDDLRRIPALLPRGSSTLAPYSSMVMGHPDIQKIKAVIITGLRGNQPNLEAYTNTWAEKYHEIWETDKTRFIARYKNINPPLSKFDADISRYGEVANNAQKEDTLQAISYVMLDCSMLKLSVVEHCHDWQSRFTRVLYEMALGDLISLRDYLTETSEALVVVPATLDDMVGSIELLAEAKASAADTQARFEPLKEQFQILANNEVDVPEDVEEKLSTLPALWEAYEAATQQSDELLGKSRSKFRLGLIGETDELARRVEGVRARFLQDGPYSSGQSPEEALAVLADFRGQLEAIHDKEASLRLGLKVFEINQEPYDDVLATETELGLLANLWGLAEQWEASYNGWKTTQFAEIRTEEMEAEAQSQFKRLVKAAREVKDKDWEMAAAYRRKIEQFKRLMPLIVDLKNHAMRDRHWAQLADEVQKSFDPHGADFTLERMIDLGLDQFGEEIGSISGAASKELSIEQSLEAIEQQWSDTNLDLAAYKDRGHFILRGTDDIYQMLEDNQVTLSSMKASRFVKAFEVTVDRWEKTLSLILEVIEMVLTVQRQWMYLENIFQGEDIRKQLPAETARFDDVNTSYRAIMTRLHDEPNAQRGTHEDGLLQRLTAMNTTLEQIQKSLDNYLETKRQVFPRFYFVSNDDLLEILGQSRNPAAIQTHLLKCFDNIKQLELDESRRGGQKLAVGMHSADGEYVPFCQAVVLDGPVEGWLCLVEDEMQRTLRTLLLECTLSQKKQKKDKWIKEWAGQLVLAVSQMVWTSDCVKAMAAMRDGKSKKGLKSMKKKQVAYLSKLTEAVRATKNKVQRKKLVALITIEVHARDVIERLMKVPNIDQTSFEWLMQLRLYWEKDHGESGNCIVRQTNTHFLYGYEYLGNSGRLVITPLTDRCYMTLTTALFLHRGGSPKGPAGTGKTETVKDLGKALGAYVIVVNCSEGLDYKSLGRMFSGLAQTGAWGCFDEFNRINIEVLSVVAQQILSILSAQSVLNPENPQTRFVFEGTEIRLKWSCGLFITMNPGYAGRTELPDNLKSMFRPISMMVPDSGLIAEIILFGQGFDNTKVLAKKVHTLYTLAKQQLSKQDHYDFGLRALVSILLNAGRKRQVMPTMPHDEILVLAMKDMNVAKMTADDLPLFLGIMSDLFPGVETQDVDYGALQAAVVEDLKENSYQATESAVTKTLQLYETKNSRHSVMIVGIAGSAKSVAWRTLQRAMTKCAKKGVPGFVPVRDYPINPKALSLAELYGEFDITTNEWADGVLSSVMRTACADEKPDQKWLVFDAPVDTLWIESMNSVMDDNKILTLINGERISMPDQVSLLFEVEDLAVASPATVSRCGMVYHDAKDLGWRPYVQSWLDKREDRATVPGLRKLFDKHVDKLQEFVRTRCTELVQTIPLNRVMSLCHLLDALLADADAVPPTTGPDAEEGARMLETWFLFACIWSLCASVDGPGRKKVDAYIRELEGQFPSKDTVYEYYVDTKNRCWAHWEQELRAGWRYNPALPFYRIQVPTVDTVRYSFLLERLLASNKPALMVGPVGTGKTSLVDAVLQRFDPGKFSLLTINMSSKTTSNNVQEIIESKVEKRTKGVFVPIGGKQLVTFMDDLNMPAKDTFGSQPPLELMRQWVDYGFWYDRQKQVTKTVRDMRLVAAMGPPGGGRNVISRRFQSRFNLINMTFPTSDNLRRIFGTMINQQLQDFDESVKHLGEKVTTATIEIYDLISARMLPTPAKIHYLFNLRDISKVFQGMLRSHRDVHDTTEALTRLWVHESFRVFSDRLVGERDRADFAAMVESKLSTVFDVSFTTLCPQRIVPIFGDFAREGAEPVYEDLQDMAKLRTAVEEKLEDYNNSPFVPMNLVLFRDAIEHVARIIRVIRVPRGNSLLIGVGGSGRQSLTRLAAFMLEYKVFQIEVAKNYRLTEFREDLKALYRLAGVENKPTVFLFVDTQIVLEDFLEDINNILSSGEVPNLFAPDELEEIRGDLAADAKAAGVEQTPDELWRFFIERVRNQLHVVLCMSPVGEPFRNRLRMYPGLVNCTTIDYFAAWPEDALLAVAERYLDDVRLSDDAEEDERVRKAVSRGFSMVQQSVLASSSLMLEELKRHNYVTPTNYLELVTGYKDMLAEKRKELGDAADKLANGLEKIDDTRVKVERMSVELEDTKKKVAAFQQECEEYLVVIVQQKRDADDQQKAVSARSEKIAEEAKACGELAANAQADLDEALPALESAMVALKALNKNDITEIKSYSKPPPLVATVMEAVMILRKSKPEWAEAKKQLGEATFIKQLIEFDKDHMSDKTLKAVAKYVKHPDFQPDVVGRVSSAARSLCMWVRAMDVYGRIFKVVEPKRKALKNAQDTLAAKEATLAEAKAKLKEVTDRVEKLQADYEAKLRQKDELRAQAEQTGLKLDRASKLISGLAGERTRWAKSVKTLRANMKFLVGDCLMAAGFLSYLGPFTTAYREGMVQRQWLPYVREARIPCTEHFDMAALLARPTDVRFWNIQGLPSDAFSTENGVIVTRGRRWPLMIDPQGQAIKWIKNMERERGLKIVDLQQPDYLRTLENSIQFGTPVLMQNVGEELDPSLAPILNKAFVKQGGRLLLRLGDKELDYNPDFRFYITTKMSNPHYTPEISTKTTIVNFAVVQEGLEAQLLGIVVRKERPDLEEQKDQLVMNIAAGKRKLADLEDKILFLLNNATGSLLDDENLVNTLNSSKVTSAEVTEQLVVAEETEREIDAAREGYRPCAQRSSILFFVLNDVEKIDPMYQFSLDAYIILFTLSIGKSVRHNSLAARIEAINEHHTYATYRYTCRGLFERHKLLFSAHINAKILEASGKLSVPEYTFFLRGGQVLDRETQLPNPAPGWISDGAWDNVTEMDRLLPHFAGVANSFGELTSDWQAWYTDPRPEAAPLPGEWENSCNELQRMILVRSLRPDRVAFVVTSFIVNNLSSRFVEPPALDMASVLSDSTPQTPLIFVLSAGVDPTKMLLDLAERRGMTDRFHSLSLGQGQAPIAERLIAEGRKHGHWVFLANCHLSLSWMPALSKLVELLESEPPHEDFRLWLSSKPTPGFPISILQAGIKMTTEPPRGVRANMRRLYATVSEDTFERCQAAHKYKKLLYGLTFFHSVLIERRKFQMLGWNIPYQFNDSDFEVSERILRIYLDEYVETPWEALKYLISGVNYGGHVTDDFDRRLLETYIKQVFNDDALSAERYRLAPASPLYTMPPDGDLASYGEAIAMLPSVDPPEAFGQHPNADISSMIRDTRTLLDTLVSLQPAVSSKGGVSREDKVLGMAGDMLTRVPEPIDYEATLRRLDGDADPLSVVLLQEIVRYNRLLATIRRSLSDLQKGVQGLVVMSTELEETFTCIFNGQVPPHWAGTYPSQKPLASWTRDLIARVDQFAEWARTGEPPQVFWLSGFTFPTGFLTALLQKAARANQVSIDSLSWEFPVSSLDEANLEPVKDGAWIRGLYLEGAGWDKKSKQLVEARPMELVSPMPIIHFKPVEGKKGTKKNHYNCPGYYYPNRAGEGGAAAWSFVIAVDLHSGERSADHWVKRGTALLMSLEN